AADPPTPPKPKVRASKRKATPRLKRSSKRKDAPAASVAESSTGGGAGKASETGDDASPPEAENATGDTGDGSPREIKEPSAMREAAAPPPSSVENTPKRDPSVRGSSNTTSSSS